MGTPDPRKTNIPTSGNIGQKWGTRVIFHSC
jgi:hypothetical protein